MKTLIVAINSKYIHASLAPWYLKASCDSNCGEISVIEFTINDNLDSILGRLYFAKPDVTAFSCYIWNIEYVMKLAEELKKILPDTIIILGGPEVSFDGSDILQKASFIDYILSGEGELSFKQLLVNLSKNSSDFSNINGLSYREYTIVKTNATFSVIEDLDSLPSPYSEEMLKSLGNRIVYYESSRGCPFSCSYCLSSITRGVRFFSIGRVESDIERLVLSGVKQIKFVDRTFNSSRKRAIQILRLLIDKYGKNFEANVINFHFEVAADLFDNEMFVILSKAPAGLIQFEIGVQTTNEDTLRLINRKTSTDTVFYNTKMLKDIGNTNLHLDLIAGLPQENYDSFKKSFDDVYKLEPHQLQLGFLKMLKGASIREETQKYGYKFREYPPYEILENNAIGFGELDELKGIEELVDRYYNSGKFVQTLKYIVNYIYTSPFEFYKGLLDFYNYSGALVRGISSREAYNLLDGFVRELMAESIEINKDKLVLFNELLKFDFLKSDNTNNLPTCVDRLIETGFKDKCFAFLRNEDNIKDILPHLVGVPAKQIIKNVHFESFSYNFHKNMEINNFNIEKIVVLFDYTKRDRVTGLYNSSIVNLDF